MHAPLAAWLAGGLLVASFLLYLPSLSNDFAHEYDDSHYVTGNEQVLKGLTPETFVWAFTTTHFFNWLPVTWLSHLLDVSIWGVNPAGHHATNALLHAINAALLLLLMAKLTGRVGASLALAALFAAHPLRVESVAWVAERKDVLAATFFLLALLAYARYTEKPGVWRYLVVALCHALGLMSKTMLVTLPCVLLLLDWWPLGRTRFSPTCDESEKSKGVARPRGRADEIRQEAKASSAAKSIVFLVLEKVPLFVLSVIASGWTVFLQGQGPTELNEQLTLGQRLANAAVAIPRYLGKTVFPADLAVLYPHPGDWAAWKVIAACALIAAITAAVVLFRRRRPYLLVGWFWFLGMLVPVLGIMQAGLQSMADRYTYLPGIGLGIAAVWLAADLLPRKYGKPNLRIGIGVTAALCVILGVLSIRQQRTWANTFTLFSHALTATDNNWLAHTHVGSGLYERGDRAGAMRHYQTALRINPKFANPYNNIGNLLVDENKPAEAEAMYLKAIELGPRLVPARLNYGKLLTSQKRYDEAIGHLTEALRLEPNLADGRSELGAALLGAGRPLEAAPYLQGGAASASSSPAIPLFNEGNRLLRAGQLPAAVEQYQKAISADPNHAESHHNLGVAFAMQQRRPEALPHLADAVRLKPAWPEARFTYARTLAETGDFEQALFHAREAVRLDPASPRNQQLLQSLQSRGGPR